MQQPDSTAVVVHKHLRVGSKVATPLHCYLVCHPAQLVLILHLILLKSRPIGTVIVGPWHWQRLRNTEDQRKHEKESTFHLNLLCIDDRIEFHQTLSLYLGVWLTSPWYVFLAAKARRLSGCWGGNMFIGFTAVTGTSRMSWECKHRPLDIPFLTTSHSSTPHLPILYLLLVSPLFFICLNLIFQEYRT